VPTRACSPTSGSTSWSSNQDPQEVTWVNEGLSDFAIGLVGYGDTRRNVHQTHAESHIFCFHGYGTVKGPSNPNPSDCGGAENSLTMWQDEGTGSEVLADYGNAWSFMQFLDDRYGRAFISALHTTAPTRVSRDYRPSWTSSPRAPRWARYCTTTS